MLPGWWHATEVGQRLGKPVVLYANRHPFLEPSTGSVLRVEFWPEKNNSKRTLTFLLKWVHTHLWFFQVIEFIVFFVFCVVHVLSYKRMGENNPQTVSPYFDQDSSSIIPQLFTSHKRGWEKNGLDLSKAIERVRAALQVISTYLPRHEYSWDLMSSCVIWGVVDFYWSYQFWWLDAIWKLGKYSGSTDKADSPSQSWVGMFCTCSCKMITSH